MVYTFKRIVHPKMSILSSLTHLSKTNIKLHWLFFSMQLQCKMIEVFRFKYTNASSKNNPYNSSTIFKVFWSHSTVFFCADQDKISVNIYWNSKSVNLVELWSDHSGWEWSLMTFKVWSLTRCYTELQTLSGILYHAWKS